MPFKKQYINWTKLISCGVIFWILLCLFDAYFVDPITKFQYSKNDGNAWKAPPAEDLALESLTVSIPDPIQISEESYGAGECIVVWNLIAFVTTIITCTSMKFAYHCYARFRARRNEGCLVEDEIDRKGSVSKIPILTTASRSLANLEDDKNRDFLKSSTFTDLSVRSSRSEVTAQYMEKQCAKLRDDMIAMQTLSLKEHTALSRRLESISKEKRELCRQLMLAHKENRAAKQQLEELLDEKNLLLKRLDSATKVFKTNTKSKKTALAKLEETQSTIANLLQEIDRLKSEQIEAQNKSRTLALENQTLKDHIVVFENKLEREIASNSITMEQKIHLEQLSQSHKDVQKVQLRLINLEKNLDKLQLSQWRKKIEDGKPAIQDERQEDLIRISENESVTPILTKAEIPLEEQRANGEKLKTGNLTDEQLEKIRIPEEQSTEDLCATPKDLCNLMNEVKMGKPFEEINGLKSTSQSDCELSCFEDRLCNDMNKNRVDVEEDEDSDDWEQYQSRIVSNSTAFKNFLQKMDHIDKLHTKLSVPM